VAEARELDAELQRLRDENADLRKRTSELSSIEAAKKRAEAKAEMLEQKVSRFLINCHSLEDPHRHLDGRDATGKASAERERTECYIRRENAEL
jgi:predicted RNase H-like nuclease (RuvC/YqgF family)